MNLLIEQALRFLGLPYLWGGKHPSQGGLDCSGFTHILGRSAGLFVSGAMSAQQQYDWLIAQPGSLVGTPKQGCFIFYGTSVKNITHVAFGISDKQIIECGGGDSSFKTVNGNQQATKNAGVRIRLITGRKDIVASILPNYGA